MMRFFRYCCPLSSNSSQHLLSQPGGQSNEEDRLTPADIRKGIVEILKGTLVKEIAELYMDPKSKNETPISLKQMKVDQDRGHCVETPLSRSLSLNDALPILTRMEQLNTAMGQKCNRNVLKLLARKLKDKFPLYKIITRLSKSEYVQEVLTLTFDLSTFVYHGLPGKLSELSKIPLQLQCTFRIDLSSHHDNLTSAAPQPSCSCCLFLCPDGKQGQLLYENTTRQTRSVSFRPGATSMSLEAVNSRGGGWAQHPFNM